MIRRNSTARVLLATALTVALAACAGLMGQQKNQQNASVMDYLYPKQSQATAMAPAATVALALPLRVGIAFVPGGYGSDAALPENERQKLLERVKAAFLDQKFISAIEVVPTAYLRPKGGFENLEQAARMFNVDVVALLSYDQVQFNDANRLSLLYWTIIGAYMVNGDQYDTHTLIDASVFDVRSRKLLMRAPGTSQVKGSAALINFSEKARDARIAGYGQAVDALIPNLRSELEKFRERVKVDQSIRVTHSPGYSGGGDLGLGGLLGIVAAFAVVAWRRRRGD